MILEKGCLDFPVHIIQPQTFLNLFIENFVMILREQNQEGSKK